MKCKNGRVPNVAPRTQTGTVKKLLYGTAISAIKVTQVPNVFGNEKDQSKLWPTGENKIRDYFKLLIIKVANKAPALLNSQQDQNRDPEGTDPVVVTGNPEENEQVIEIEPKQVIEIEPEQVNEQTIGQNETDKFHDGTKIYILRTADNNFSIRVPSGSLDLPDQSLNWVFGPLDLTVVFKRGKVVDFRPRLEGCPGRPPRSRSRCKCDLIEIEYYGDEINPPLGDAFKQWKEETTLVVTDQKLKPKPMGLIQKLQNLFSRKALVRHVLSELKNKGMIETINSWKDGEVRELILKGLQAAFEVVYASGDLTRREKHEVITGIQEFLTPSKTVPQDDKSGSQTQESSSTILSTNGDIGSDNIPSTKLGNRFSNFCSGVWKSVRDCRFARLCRGKGSYDCESFDRTRTRTYVKGRK